MKVQPGREMTNAGMVKIAPAATDSPIEPAVRAMFSSRIEPFEEAQDRHADDRRGIGGRDGLAGAQSQVGVGRAQNHAHHEPEEHRAQRELLHIERRADERFVLATSGVMRVSISLFR